MRRAWRLAGTALVVAGALAAVPPSSGADGHGRAPSPSAHPTYVVHLDRDTAAPAGDSSRTSSRSIRSWPGKKIRYWADLPQSYQWSLQAALRSWNATGLDMTFVRAPKSRAQLQIVVGKTYGSDGYATVGYQQRNWVHLRPALTKPIPSEPASYARVVAAHIIAHELGHVLGLEHTSGCELMTPVLMLPTCPIMADRIGFYSRIVDRPALKKTVGRYGGRLSLGPKSLPLDSLPPRLRGVSFHGGLDADAPVKLTWTPPKHAPAGSHVLLLVTNGGSCRYPVSADFWGMTAYDGSRLRRLQEIAPDKGSVSPPAVDISRHCYALTLVNRSGAGSAPQGKVLKSWLSAPVSPTVQSVRRGYDQEFDPSLYKVVVDFDDSHGEELLMVARPSGHCANAWPTGESYDSHLVAVTPGEPAQVNAYDSAFDPIPDACLTFFTMRADEKRISAPVSYQVGSEPLPAPPVINAVTRTGPDTYTVDATYDSDVARLAVVVKPTGQCVTSWPGGDPTQSLTDGFIDTTGTSQPCLSFFTVNAEGATSPTAVTRQMTAAPAPPKPTMSAVAVNEFGTVSGHTSLDPEGQFGLAMTVDPTESCQPFPSGASAADYQVSIFDDGTGTAFQGFSGETHPCLTFYSYNYDGVLSAGTTVQL